MYILKRTLNHIQKVKGLGKGILIKLIIAICCTITFSVQINAGDYYSNENKKLFVFPEYSSLGGAGLTFLRDGAPMSNPANICLDSTNQVSLSYAGYYNNTFSTSAASFVYSLSKKMGLGMFLGYLFVPDIDITTGLPFDSATGQLSTIDPSLIYYKTASEILLNFSFGYKALEHRYVNLSVGAALHCLRRRLIDEAGYGIGCDIGLTAMLPVQGIRVSLFADDITTNYIRWSGDYNDKGLPHVRFGLGWRTEIPNLYSRFSIMYKSPDLLSNEGVGYNLFAEKSEKIDEPFENRVSKDPTLLLTQGCYGIEYVIQHLVALRVGLNEHKRVYFGGGLNLFSQALSFEFSVSGLVRTYELSNVYFLSAKYQW